MPETNTFVAPGPNGRSNPPGATGDHEIRPRRVGSTRATIVGLLAVLTMVLVGCSSSGSTASSGTSTTAKASASSTTYPAGKVQVCQARDQLKTSVEALLKPSLLVQGTTAIKTATTKVQDNLTALKAAAKQDYQPQIQAVETSIKDLQTAISNHDKNSATKNLQNIGTAIAKVGSTSATLFDQLKTSCGS